MKLAFLVPVKATSSLNARMHWRVRARQVKAERMATRLVVRLTGRDRIAVACLGATITLVRVGPRKLDSDNVQGALKAIRDEVAAQLGIDDGDERLTWLYSQERGAYAVRVVIEPRGAVAA